MTTQKLKSLISPLDVAIKYLGNPIRKTSAGSWYKSPFRNERTASFLVNNQRGFHDFGTSKHYDVISFIEEYYTIDFKTATKVLIIDFNLIEDSESNELSNYLIKRKKEEVEIERKIDEWYYKKFNELCDEYQKNRRLMKHIKGNALVFAYSKDVKLEIALDMFMNINDRYELYKEFNKND